MPWFADRTLRSRLARWYSLAGIALFGGFSAAVYLFVEATMARPLDHLLKEDLAHLRKRLSVDVNGQVQWDGQPLPSDSLWPASNPWFELWDENGRLIARRWPFSDRKLERPPVAPHRGREVLSLFTVSPGVAVRSLTSPLTVETGERWMLRVMRLHEPDANALRALLLGLCIALPVVIVLLVLGGYALTRRWLQPLDQMVAEARRITAHDLGRRLPTNSAAEELNQLGVTFNATLTRLEDSFRALDRFVADASHELLTPLTTLRSVGEIGLRGSREPEEYRNTIASMLEEAQRLQQLVELLLQLARAEGGAMLIEPQSVSLKELLVDCADDARLFAEERSQEIAVTCPEEFIQTDPLLLRQAVQNLIDNAVKYSPVDQSIEVHARCRDTHYEIAILDRGPGIPREFSLQVTERFFRLQFARDRKSGGAGLGLALTRAYVAVLGGQLRYHPRPGGGSVFCLLLPLALPPGRQRAAIIPPAFDPSACKP